MVEDSDAAASDLRAILESIAPDAFYRWATSRDAAIQELEAGEWDLITCDLRIPSQDGSADADEAYGLQVHSTLR